jgi:hypothetical protein
MLDVGVNDERSVPWHGCVFHAFSFVYICRILGTRPNKTTRAEAPGMAMPIWKSRGITSADPTRRLVAFAQHGTANGR